MKVVSPYGRAVIIKRTVPFIIANFSGLSDEVLAAVKLALKHKDDLSALVDVKEVEVAQGMRIGAVICLQAIAVRLGIVKALGTDRQGKTPPIYRCPPPRCPALETDTCSHQEKTY